MALGIETIRRISIMPMTYASINTVRTYAILTGRFAKAVVPCGAGWRRAFHRPPINFEGFNFAGYRFTIKPDVEVFCARFLFVFFPYIY